MASKLTFRVNAEPVTYVIPTGGKITLTKFAGGLPLVCHLEGEAARRGDHLRPFSVDGFRVDGSQKISSLIAILGETREIKRTGDSVHVEQFGARIEYTVSTDCGVDASLKEFQAGSYNMDSIRSENNHQSKCGISSSSRLKTERKLVIGEHEATLEFSSTGLEEGDHFNRDIVEIKVSEEGRILQVSGSFKATKEAREFMTDNPEPVAMEVRRKYNNGGFSLSPDKEDAQALLKALGIRREGIDLRRTVEMIGQRMASETGVITNVFESLVFNPERVGQAPTVTDMAAASK